MSAGTTIGSCEFAGIVSPVFTPPSTIAEIAHEEGVKIGTHTAGPEFRATTLTAGAPGIEGPANDGAAFVPWPFPWMSQTFRAIRAIRASRFGSETLMGR